ncbi:MAG: hypothetical protein A2653_02085 [Candidatus Zambryskibacteria bacterium RIFCSPHIGHO2_01_FULL_43_25]|uniref:HTH arsR-type domain-containing protein n=1 Tax=Candidatus Zambryskibacteria bacterium RIFCSPLOWO2_01_FULL_45_21 TaxID=1802761 RepID=A0A1G2U2R5_9BACT|nr:MAG: hypothetical protein A2653_02085 [Candidatus Zambryskibacteria bacterium RIFCSPHIGHO2_01_FULL_43_25]OHA99980.1 MAG: hypothetical protein A3E94_03130 [Candidatus Zambryskibacteria bacterium RIFCSPHIGHO2_12_FULL_44_12b]OHB03816.1 MAG: hypothetical protein A3B14_03945 [Candidatus Zambryskibacteria bacterium RIFCSPLOWO2_01_FULL_45_21]
MNKKLKSSRQLERHLKGVANHWRIEILLIIGSNQGISLDEINSKLKTNIKTISEHTRRLSQAGLVEKHYKGRIVEHRLSPYGKIFLQFIKTFSHS